MNNDTTTIKRFDPVQLFDMGGSGYGQVTQDTDGDFVLHRDHLAAVERMEASTRESQSPLFEEIRRLKEQLSTLTTAATLAGAFAPVIEELHKATTKITTWPTDPLHALAVLGEEFGELTKEVVQFTYEPEKSSVESVRKEAIQTAAMAMRFVLSLDAYTYGRAEQHIQVSTQP